MNISYLIRIEDLKTELVPYEELYQMIVTILETQRKAGKEEKSVEEFSKV